MAEFNYYPVFVADQVLTADHLNEIVNYFEEQDRLTRNKLIGIGIVCGLELKVDTTQIVISKGCGITSAGYLIVQDALTLTHYRPYELPADFSSRYKSTYGEWDMWELLTNTQAEALEDGETIKGHGDFLKDKIVVLLLEMSEIPLKNCIDTDCDDKGEKIQFSIKPVLVEKNDVDKLLKSLEEPRVKEPKSSVEPVLRDVQLRRFNVPVTQLLSTDAVLNAFLQIVDESLLKRLAEVLNYCYFHYKPILSEEPVNPFNTVFELFLERLEYVKTKNPFFIQYYYDWIDDIIKAYYEFKSKIFDVQTMCCPDEDMFPLHLMLGEAVKNTVLDVKTKYRHYFIYSPLFNQQKDLLAEVQLLFRRIKVLVQNYVVPDPKNFANATVKITPSKHLDRTLSQRCIPYYYNPHGLYQCWSWSKTRKGNARYNHSYNAYQYNSLDAIVDPLKYDIERFDFFRIEGHIGKNYSQAITTVVGQRDQYNLPFEVIALSTATITKYAASKDDHDCHFRDLDALYEVIIAELVCKFGELACTAAKLPYTPRTGNATAAGTSMTAGPGTVTTATTVPAEKATGTGSFAGKSGISAGDSVKVKEVFASAKFSARELNIKENLIADFRIASYKKGDFIKTHCGPFEKGTVGEFYINSVANGYSFVKPLAKLNFTDINVVYAHLFYFIDCVENLMMTILPVDLGGFDIGVFKARFKTLIDEITTVQGELLELLMLRNNAQSDNPDVALLQDFALDVYVSRIQILLTTCLDERLEALKKEYRKRSDELQTLINFMNYFKKHPGMEHKAGVPKGGTFILVYHEVPPKRKTPGFVTREKDFVITHVPGSNVVKDIPDSSAATKSLVTNINEVTKAAFAKDPQLLRQFELALNKYLDVCKDMDDDTKDEITEVLSGIPTPTTAAKFQIPEYSVIADFYLPYLCCSDCPPVAFVVPKETEEALSIRIRPTEFCNNDQNVYQVLVMPAGGELTASKGGVEPGTFEFKPNGLKAGINTLTYTAKDGRKTSIDVKIFKAFDLSIKYSIQEDGITVNFSSNAPAEGKPTWDFGDGSTSTESSPTHTYKFAEEKQTFTVKVTVMDGPCLASDEEVITLTRPIETVFGIEPTLYCAHDKAVKTFRIEPIPVNVKEIRNDNKLALSRDATTGGISFVPARQKLTDTQEYHLEYRGIGIDLKIVVPDAGFIMKLTRLQDPAGQTDILLSVAARKNSDEYLWIVEVEGQSQPLQFVERKFELSYNQYKLSADHRILISLTVNNKVPAIQCSDKKEFRIYYDIFRKFVDNGEFDNNTVV